MFKLSEESLEKEEKRRVTEICREIIGIELKELEEERRSVKEKLKRLKERIKEYEERMSRIEARLKEIVEWTKKGKKRNKWRRRTVEEKMRET